MKSRTMDSFFKKKDTQGTTSFNQEVTAEDNTPQELPPVPETCEETHPSKIPRVETDTIDLSKFEFDPASRIVLVKVRDTAPNYSQRGDAQHAYTRLRSFEFVFILHVIKEVIGISDHLCQALQHRSQDILNAMNLVSTTKVSIQELRDIGWDNLLKDVISFGGNFELDVPDMNANYVVGRSRNRKENVTVEHHY
ncbi:hypothetical protein COLO4_28854 [Corchorus olitorius]|uniref:Uncharacterized protein n=1 Tax=Corchorus olitorius TaxID=93759 RepID=A0A1R3HHV0_9ROSI|nr:hypothetical protein COLO4_28854 [Corchorus olitorius]